MIDKTNNEGNITSEPIEILTKDLSPWSKWCSPWDPRCSTEFYLVTSSDKKCGVFKNYSEALDFLTDSIEGEHGTIHKVYPTNRVYPSSCNCYKP